MDLSLQLYAVGGVGHRVAQPLKHLIRPKSKERILDTTTPFICSTCMNRWKGYFVTDTHNDISYQDTISFSSSWTTDNDIIPVAVWLFTSHLSIIATNEECGKIWRPNLEMGGGFCSLILRKGCRLEKDVDLRSLFTVLSYMCLYLNVVPKLEHNFPVIVL